MTSSGNILHEIFTIDDALENAPPFIKSIVKTAYEIGILDESISSDEGLELIGKPVNQSVLNGFKNDRLKKCLKLKNDLAILQECMETSKNCSGEIKQFEKHLLKEEIREQNSRTD